MPKLLKEYPILTICLLVALMLLPQLDAIQVSIMEARNFVTAREMVLNDNWLLTTMNGEPRYQKPPLPTWLTAFSGLFFGIKSVFGMRLPAVLLVMVTGSFMYKLSRSMLKSRSHALINALIVVTSFYVIGIVIEAPWDIFTHGFMLVAIFHLHKLFKAEGVVWKHTVVAGLFIGFSILSKGPVSFYALLLPFLIAYGVTFKYKNAKAKVFSFFSVLVIALVVGGLWYVYVRLNDPTTFNAITEKETGNWTSYNVRPFYYYWSFFIQSGLWTIPAFISLLFPYLKTRVSNYKAYKFSLLWTILAVVLLSIIPEKKSRYLMPVLIPLAFNIGFYIEYLIRRFKDIKDKRETLPVYFNFGLIGTIGIAFPIVFYILFKSELQQHWLPFVLASIVLVTLGVFILLRLKQKNMKHVFLLTVLFFAAVFAVGLPLMQLFKNDDFNSIATLKNDNDTRGIPLYSFKYVAPETIWQYGDMIPRIPYKNNAFQFPSESKFGVLTNLLSAEDLKLLKDNFNVKEVETYDLNQAKEGTQHYNDRLTNTFYILSEK
ncbi:phospholipid carrier-dependent glycosyltransferase [Bizionia saleffrena]|uniref:Phospholipid carrier-dependent glycosyltransferase n=1 Tax=Bizionia saleffrena TaxID=291189 RepID=A0A8H2QGI6_9FLAO|nr:phospholipid carrier-dependent glycosyltransferase [Bizionia saleffrena]TYB80191.1 phospholipid carrier-dependent glycosyltransferase [Bizionia saleffrena]